MVLKPPALPCRSALTAHVLRSLRCYWPQNEDRVAALTLDSHAGWNGIQLPLRLKEIKLPHWAAFCAVDGKLLVPEEIAHHASYEAESDQWQGVDWFLAAFLLLEAWHERAWEHRYGPIHSYSFCLRGWDERAWENAWVNRIALFLREWAARNEGADSENLFGPLPKAEVVVTHDVDALAKTIPIRIKQTAFILLNAAREIVEGRLRTGLRCIRHAANFFFRRTNWWLFDELLAAEKTAKIRSIFNFYANGRPKTLKAWFFDPGYDCSSPRARELMKLLRCAGHEIGLHPSFDSWARSEEIAFQKKALEEASGARVATCRQHWLRFSWSNTWFSQENAGLDKDFTLMFNDRPGFRNSAAIEWHPYNANASAPLGLKARPTILMDSHLYDYRRLSPEQRSSLIARLVDECSAVRGQVAVLWHPHTLSAEYNWRQSFHVLLNHLQPLGAS